MKKKCSTQSAAVNKNTKINTCVCLQRHQMYYLSVTTCSTKFHVRWQHDVDLAQLAIYIAI
jgi:hypothetical protein